MKNLITINGYKAKIEYDPETEQLRGEFIGLNGGADFYADNLADLHKQGKESLRIFLEICKEKGIEPHKHYSGKFNVRVSPKIHALAVATATAHNQSLNEWISQTISQAVEP